MWWGSGQDPGGSEGEGPSKEPPQNQQLQDLQEQFESQQMLIAQLKEMLKKTEHSSSVSREKVEEYATTLTKMNARAKRGKLRRTEGAKIEEETTNKPEISKEITGKKSTPAKEKVNLLRQQLEENRLKLAQRDKNQKGIEEMVNQLKAQLDDSQIFNQSTTSIPKLEAKTLSLTYNTDLSKEELISILQNKDTQIEELSFKIQHLEGNVLDLQENLKEKDSVIDARTKAITLLSENLSKKGKNTLDMLDETKEQMRDMQEHFVSLESKMKEENTKIQLDLDTKVKEIEELTLANNKLTEEINKLESTNTDLQEKLEATFAELNNFKLELSTSELKLQDLTKLNQELEATITELKNKEDESSEQSLSSSPQRGKKQKFKTWKKSKPKPTEAQNEEQNLSRIAELELLVEELKSEMEKLRTAPTKSEEENAEVINLKAQLDTMNKNLIKTKAQYKAKLKELQKKSSPGDPNEKLIGLESENVKLEQRIAELEEEKGNLQLKLVDVDTNRDKDHIADLENKIEEQKMEIENHIRIITILETQITDKSNEISDLRNELANLTHIENAQVCSEITSVQLEEQLDKQAVVRKEIEDKYEELKKQNDVLLEKIEELNKEKQDMNTKLVNYMQENMELLDRLEKLSAEKVSSAESIEIVESLTQQEKLEIEAYQKNLEFTSDKEHIEQIDNDNSELNESVSKLTEDSSELLERIELFTVERREVMEKMESLHSEKEHLLSKLNQLETEKTEFVNKCNTLSDEKDNLLQQIQTLSQQDVIDGIRMDSASNTNTLVEEYKVLVDNQKIEIVQLKQELLRMSEENSQIPIKNDNLTKLSIEKEGLQVVIASLNEQFFTLNKEYESFLEDNKKMKAELKRKSETIFEKDNEEKDIQLLKQKLIEYEAKVKEDAEEIKFLHETIEDNKNELIKSADYISSLTSELSVKHSELAAYKTDMDQMQVIIQQLNNEIEHKKSDCQNHIETIDALSVQLQELKTILGENFKELEKYEDLNNRIIEADTLMDMKDYEIDQLRKEKQQYSNRIIALEEELKCKDENFKEACQQLKDRCLTLENKIQANSGSLEDIKVPFEEKIRGLENECKKLESKHKENLDKMKKIAANLKKKVVTCQELETKLSEIKEKWENECKEKSEKDKIIEEQRTVLEENSFQIELLSQQLQEKDTILNNLQLELDSEKIKFQNELSNYISLNNQLQAELANYDNEIKKLNSQIHETNIDSDAMNKEINYQLQEQNEELKMQLNTTKNALETKIQEKDMYIENIESENQFIKERFSKLNEGLSEVQNRRRSLEQYVLELGAELEAKSIACDEVSLSENILEERLASLIQHDKSIENKLKEMTLTNQNMNKSIENLTYINMTLQNNLTETQVKLKEKEHECEKLFNLESDSVQLREIISSLEHDLKKIHFDYESKLLEKTNEIESMEQELNTQIDELNNQRKAAVNRCELLQDKVQEYSENEQILQQDIETLRGKLINIQEDLDKQLKENELLNNVNANNLIAIEQLKHQISNVQPVEVDIQNMHTEILKLQKLITERDNDIQNYQRQNMQLQMSLSNVNSQFDFSDSSNKMDLQDDAALLKQVHDLTNEIKVYQQKTDELEKINIDLQNQNDKYSKSISDLQAELSQHKHLLLRGTLEHDVDSILCEAQQIAEIESENISKPSQSVEIQEQIQKSSVQEVETVPYEKGIKEAELLKKIKALEFMLYNVEKEKDDAVTQCHSLSNELTRLIYEREGLIGHKKENEKKEADISAIESEIISDKDIISRETDKQELQNLEYIQISQVPTSSVASGVPVEESVIQPKSAYVCYADDKNLPPDEAFGWGVEDDILSASLEGQIMQEKDIPMSQTDKKMLHELEFEKVTVEQPKDHKKPVCEKPVDPKSAYLCYPDDASSVDIQDAFASEEDGWGWNAEELKLEAKHQALTFAAPVQPVPTAEDNFKEKIQQLEDEKQKLADDLKTQQQKSAKLIKKLKEMKLKNDSLTAQLQQKSSNDFDVLDMAIQDELHSQIKNLETKLKEINEDKAKDKSEKEGLLKRIDMLTAANERMIEMKEKQDNDIQQLQFHNRQLSSKLEQFEWGQDSPHKEIQKLDSTIENLDTNQLQKEYELLTKKVDELNAVVNDLTMDNEEMQLLLEEQRKLRLEAEKALASLPIQENMKTEQEYLLLQNEKEAINNAFIHLVNENKTISEELQAVLNENEILSNKISNFNQINDNDICPRLESIQEQVDLFIKKKKDDFNKQTLILEKVEGENNKLKEQMKNLVSQVESMSEQNKVVLKHETTQLHEQIQLLENRNKELELLVSQKQNNINDLNVIIENLTADKQTLEIKLREISSLLSTENSDQLENLGAKLEIIVKEVEEKNNEVLELNKILNLERIEFEQKLSTTLDQLAQEWAERVEQRGNDVAESWKLHVDNRESEFAQIEQTLRMELTDIYNKNETLLTENNELQKKVELLLQEKQATTSDNKTEALQDILSERQSEILTLSQQLQEVSVQLEVKNNEIVSLQQIIESIQKQNFELVDKNKELHLSFKNYEQLNKQLETENKDLKKYSKQNEELNAQLQIENKELEILKQTIEGLTQELNKLREELYREKTNYVESDNKLSELQSDIQNLELKLQDIIKLIDGNEFEIFDNTFDKLLYVEDKIVHIVQNLHDLRIVKDQLASEKALLEESYNQISASVSNNQQSNEKLTSELFDMREMVRKLEIDLDESTHARNFDLIQMNTQMKELETKYEDQLKVKNIELETLQQQLQEYYSKYENEKSLLEQEINIKLSEINNLQLEVESLKNQYQEMLSQETAEKLNLEEQLKTKSSEVYNLQMKIEELDTLVKQESAQKDKLRELLDEQTHEISKLKQELEKKTEDYNHVYEELESMVIQEKQQIKTPEKHVRFKEPVAETETQLLTSEGESSVDPTSTVEPDNVASRAELDLALYMLHQRDVRCEELTVELMQLLEERDTLQLRLSNAIRINEELRSKLSPTKINMGSPDEMITPKVLQPTGAIPKSKSSDIVLKATGTELATEALESDTLGKSNVEGKQDLDNKLSQLRSVGYNRDKTLKDDQESRYLQQMSIMQQHRDIASRLPPEAAAHLVDASYTLSRDVQSPSKVLLNWLWGKSTPKVNDI